MKKYFFCISAIFLFFAGLIFPQSAKEYKLSVEDAVIIALKNNVSIKRQQITLDAAKRAKNHSWNSLSPAVSVSANAQFPFDSLSDNSTDYTARIEVSATASLSFSANLYTAINGAKLSYEQNKISFDDAVRNIEFSVRQSYYELLYEKENIDLQEQNLKIARQQYENNLAKYNSGRLSEVDALSAEVNYKSKIPSVEGAVLTYKNDMDSFKQVLGLMLDDNIELTGSLKDYLYLEKIQIDEKSYKSSTEKIIELKLKSARNSLLEKRFNAYTPSVSANLSMSKSSWEIGNDSAKNPSKTTSATLSATLPLDGVLPWSARNDNIDNAKDSVKDLELQLDNEKKNFLRTINSLLRSINQSQEAIKYKQASVELAERTYIMTSEAYNRGTKDLLTLQNANNTLLSAKVSLNNETLTLAKNIMSLENLIGVEALSLIKQ